MCEGSSASGSKRCSQDECRFLWPQFDSMDHLSTTAACECGHTCRCSQIAHPVHHPKRGDQVAFLLLLDDRDRGCAHLPAFAPANREQVDRPDLHACTHQGRCQQVAQTYKKRDSISFRHIFLPVRLLALKSSADLIGTSIWSRDL